MKKIDRSFRRVLRAGVFRGIWLSSCLVFSGGCALTHPVPKPAHQEAATTGNNAFNAAPQLPPELKRVAFLPATAEAAGDSSDGLAVLEPVLRQELSRTGRFEMVPVTHEQLREWTGRVQWKTVDQLPADFFQKIREKTGCNAVFFSHLTHYHAYPPIVIGWRLALVDGSEPRTRWAVDEFYDGGDEAIAKAARLYNAKHLPSQPMGDPSVVLGSPRRFGQFVTSALLGTLPVR